MSTKQSSKSDRSPLYERIYAVVRQIPPGKVATYGQVAELASLAGKARLVGYALFRVTEEDDVPWQRVINAQGQVSRSPKRNGTDYKQRSLLELEGIIFNAQDKIDWQRYRWQPDAGLVEAAIAAYLAKAAARQDF